MADETERFIEACENIRSNLERKYGREFTGVGAAVRYAREQGFDVVVRHDRQLKALIELRNVIQHNAFKSNQALATPRRDAVEAIEQIAALVEKAPPIHKFMVAQPATLAPDDSLAQAARQVVGINLSQMPVYDRDTYVGLFTTNAMARWISEAFQRNEGALIEENTAVAEVLPHGEDRDVAEFVRPTVSARKVCARLCADDAPAAVLVTTSGTAEGELQGIVTKFDVPRIQAALTVTFPR